MKILYVSLAGDSGYEDVADNPKKYGGSAVVPRALRQRLNDFYIASSHLSCETVPDKTKCFPLSKEEREALIAGAELETIVSGEFDLIFHAHPNLFLNTRKKQAVWSVGFMEEVHQLHKHVLLFAPKYQYTRFNSRPNVYEFTLGTDIPSFKEYRKEDFALVIGNQRKWIQSASLAQVCNQMNLHCVFAGPVDEEYKDVFLKSLNNTNSVYLGEISLEEKVKLNKKALCVFQLHINPTCATLAAKEALAYGTPIITSRVGEWPDFIQDGVNGFIIDGWSDIVRAYHACKQIKQIDCYNSVKKYSADIMTKDLVGIFNTIIKSLD